LGKGILHRSKKGLLVAELVEVEAYLGGEDPASHAYRIRTPRNRVMFERGGACYVYLSYGMNLCMNVVAGPEGLGQAVLLRAARPLEGLDVMRKNRKQGPESNPRNLMSGPGKLTQALGVDMKFNGSRFGEADLILFDLEKNYSDSEIAAGPRIGISKAVEFPYRFVVRDSPWLSRKL